MSEVFTTEKINLVRDALNTCTMCGFCKSVCPSFKAINWDTDLSRGRIVMTYGISVGQLQPDESVVRSMYTCTTCADCVRRCPSKVEIVDIIELCRADLVKNGYALPKHKQMCQSILENNNPYGEKKSVAEVMKGWGYEPHKAPVAYFAGCTATYRNVKTAKSTLAILEKMGEDFTVLPEVCCGSVMSRVGWPEEDRLKFYKKNVEAIEALGVKTLVLSCAGCYRMFKVEYPKYLGELPFEVKHITEYLAGKKLNLTPLEGVVTYHDPCHLGRHCGVYDAPREVIKQFPGVDFREMKYTRATSHCCGGGGGVRAAFPEEAAKISNTRLDEAGFADLVITTCPFCVTNLSAQIGDRKLKVVDLTELVAEHLQ